MADDDEAGDERPKDGGGDGDDEGEAEKSVS